MFEQKFISESICFEWTSLNGYHVYLLDIYMYRYSIVCEI